MLAFLTNNDVVNNSRRLELDPTMPYFVLRDGQLVLDDAFRTAPEFRRKRWTYALLNHLHVVQVIARAVILWRAHGALDPHVDAALAAETDPSLYGPPVLPEWSDAWEITEALVREMSTEVHERGALFTVTTLSNALQVYPDPEVRRRVVERMGIRDLWYPDARIKTLGEREHFPVVALAPLLAAYAQEHGTFLHGFDNTILGVGHWNENGHAIAGEAIAERLCPLLAAPGVCGR